MDDRTKFVNESGRRYLDAFAIATDKRYHVNWHHELIAKALERGLERAVQNKKTRLILTMPPRHGKSDLASVKFSAFALGKYPDLSIMITSYSTDLATGFGRQTRDLMLSDSYQHIFDTKLAPDQKAKGKWATREGGIYRASGVGAGITGGGFKIGIVDDPFKDRKEAESALIRDNVWEWWTSTFTTREEGYGLIVVIVTRWHLDDLVGRLKQKEIEDRQAGLEEFDEWEEINLPAIAEVKEEHRDIGDPLWPWKFTKEMLTAKKNQVGIYDWSALYQQHPISSETQEFDKTWFKTYKEDDIKHKDLRHVTLVDPAISEKAEADNSCVRTVGKEKTEPDWYLREETAGKLDPLQLIDAIFWHHEKYRSEVWIEGVAYQKSLEYFILEEQRKRGIFFTVRILKMNNSTSKRERVRGLIPLYKAGVIWHRENGDDSALEREALEFPVGRRDDRIDALANGLEAFENTKDKRIGKSRKRKTPPMSEYGG